MATELAKLDDIARQITDVRLAVTSLAVKLDLTLAQASDHERRLRALERRVWALPTIGTLIGSAGLVAAFWRS